MRTTHAVRAADARDLALAEDSIDLVVTSPPYPMIELWDDLFCALDPAIGEHLESGDGEAAFEAMHAILGSVWDELARVLRPGGIACINVGDATRSLEDGFRLFPNHVAITRALRERGLRSLPDILWRKPTNSHAKFLGSGTLPTNAYATLEHEHLLVFRNGDTRKFEPRASQRYESAFFWEERNRWFSDLWTDVRGTTQPLADGDDHAAEERQSTGSPTAGSTTTGNPTSKRQGAEHQSAERQGVEGPRARTTTPNRVRSGAFPLAIPFRLIAMYSVYGDRVLDPFWGTGTTTLAALLAGRSSIGYDLDADLVTSFADRLDRIEARSREHATARLDAHRAFVDRRRTAGESLDYDAEHYEFPVVTRQERRIRLYAVENVQRAENHDSGDIDDDPFRDETPDRRYVAEHAPVEE